MTDLLKMIEQWEVFSNIRRESKNPFICSNCSADNGEAVILNQRILKLSKALKIAIEELKSTASKDCGLVSVLEANAAYALKEIEAVMKKADPT